MEYTDGILTSVYDGGWDPSASPSWLDKLLYKKDLSFTVNVGKNSQLNLREGAGISYESVGKLSNGSILNPTGNANNGWMEVTTEENQTGWINSDYTTPNY